MQDRFRSGERECRKPTFGMLEILGSDEGWNKWKVSFAVERKWQDLVPDDRFQRL